MNKNKQFVITINRELGSGGRTVGRKLAERLGVKYYDKAIVEGLKEKYGLTTEEIEHLKTQKKSWRDEFNAYYKKLLNSIAPGEFKPVPTTAAMFETERRILQDLAAQESCVVAGRSGFLVFREWKNHLSVFIQASMQKRIERLHHKRGLRLEDAIDIIDEVDAGRETYLQNYADKSRYDTHNYDIVISMDELSEDDATDIIMEFINRSTKNSAQE